MAIRYSEDIDFTATCVLSGLDGLSVTRCRDGLRDLVIVSREVVKAAGEFIQFKFGHVPGGDSAFIWSTNGHRPQNSMELLDEENSEDCNRFFRLMKHYERSCCS